jgi:xyloglucan-specific endo-beta-1,4-glucanase
MQAIQLSKVTTVPTTWNWAYTGTNIVADVAYDMFTSSTATGSAQFEIMVWLAALGGAGPISTTGSTPIASPNIGGHTFNLFKGPNGAMTVFSFVATSSITAFTGDLAAFFKYLETNQGLSTSQFLLSIQAGTEPFTYVSNM